MPMVALKGFKGLAAYTVNDPFLFLHSGRADLIVTPRGLHPLIWPRVYILSTVQYHYAFYLEHCSKTMSWLLAIDSSVRVCVFVFVCVYLCVCVCVCVCWSSDMLCFVWISVYPHFMFEACYLWAWSSKPRCSH